MKRFMIAISFLASSCEDVAQTPAPESTIEWTDGPDDSRVGRLAGDFTKTTYRCWKKSDKYQCLSVTYMKELGYSIDRFMAPTLPAAKSDIHDQDGYLCEFLQAGGDMWKESMWGRDGLLISHSGFPGEDDFWSADFARQYLRDNGLPSTSYFDCQAMVDVLDNGSMAAIASTSVTFNVLAR